LGTDADRSDGGARARESSSRPGPAPPLTLPEAAAYLNVSQRFMRRLVLERRIAFHKLGHLLRFCITDLDQFLASGRVEVAESPGRRRR
jgi:excisionase family DNA binding protein